LEQVSPLRSRILFTLSICAAMSALLRAQQAPASAPGAAPVNNRVLGVLPNYRTAEESDPFSPLSVRRKFYIGYKDSTDYPVFLLAAGLAGLSQATGAHERLGTGWEGYGKRLGASVADQLVGNFMTESVMPSLLHQDPRYFRRGRGGVWSRTGYAASRILVAKSDKGKWTFNYAEVSGNAISAGVGNAYYPGERNLGDNLQRFGSQMAVDAFSQILKEFWPDVKRKYFSHSKP
jgi:hypothetical protein